MRYMAIDLGDRRTGVAQGDGETRLVSPLDVVEVDLELRGGGALLEALARIVDAQIGRSGELVVGLPKNMDGTEGPRARIVRAFAQRLAARTGLRVHLQDERLSTAEADWSMNRSGLTRKQKKERRDARAAGVILTDFLATLTRPEERQTEPPTADAPSSSKKPRTDGPGS